MHGQPAFWALSRTFRHPAVQRPYRPVQGYLFCFGLAGFAFRFGTFSGEVPNGLDDARQQPAAWRLADEHGDAVERRGE